MIIEFHPSHLAALDVQEKQGVYADYITDVTAFNLSGDTFTYIEDNEVKAVIGMEYPWKGRAIVWAMIGKVNRWLTFHRHVKSLLDEHAEKRGIIRLELTTEAGFVESEHWAKMLGFKEESLMSNFGVDGKDHKMWVITWQQQSRS